MGKHLLRMDAEHSALVHFAPDWWGHQIPAWFTPSGEIFVAMTEEEAYAAAVAACGDDVVFDPGP